MAARGNRTVRGLRRSHRSQVLRCLYFHGPLSRQELGPYTGLSSGTVSNVVTDLSADGLLAEAGAVDSDGGRPRTLLRVEPRRGYVVGIDVGEAGVRAELFDLTLTRVARCERPLSSGGYDIDHVVAAIHDTLQVLLGDPAQRGELLGVGIGVPGIVGQGRNGENFVHGQTVDWDFVPLDALVRQAAELPDEVPLFLENGATTLGQAEMWFGAGRGVSNGAVALLGSGVGACLVTGDALDEGGTRAVGVEWGHTTLRVRGRRCRCGAAGCLEAYLGAEALLQRWADAGGHPGPETAAEADLTSLLSAAYPDDPADTPDPTAVTLLDETAEYLGAGIADLVNLFRCERVLLGGWAGLLLGRYLLPAVRSYVEAYALRYFSQRVTVELSSLGPDGVTLGAATLPLAAFLDRGGSGRGAPPRAERSSK